MPWAPGVKSPDSALLLAPELGLGSGGLDWLAGPLLDEMDPALFSISFSLPLSELDLSLFSISFSVPASVF